MTPGVVREIPSTKTDWKTLAIGRHLIDVPGSAKLLQTWRYADIKIERLNYRGESDLLKLIDARENQIRKLPPQKEHGNRFIERVGLPGQSVTLISWGYEDSDLLLVFDTYFITAGKAMLYSGEVSRSRKAIALENRRQMGQEWRTIPNGESPSGVGYVAGDMLLAANRFNAESWELSIQLTGKPDVSLRVTGFAVAKPDVGLRERAGGALAGMLGAAAGLQQLRNRRRPVGPIEADEILVAATQDGKRHYGFKWEAPGKAGSLAEPNLNVTLRVGESAYETNAQSFLTDEEALEVWDRLISSIRLRPGAAG